MQQVQASAIGAATTAIMTHALAQGLMVCSAQTGEHADGSGRWHVLLSCCTRATHDDVLFRVLVNADGTIDPVEVLEGATH
ncbi:MAG TPA: hypothetical protein VF156_15525 [Agromyces sp.]